VIYNLSRPCGFPPAHLPLALAYDLHIFMPLLLPPCPSAACTTQIKMALDLSSSSSNSSGDDATLRTPANAGKEAPAAPPQVRF